MQTPCGECTKRLVARRETGYAPRSAIDLDEPALQTGSDIGLLLGGLLLGAPRVDDLEGEHRRWMPMCPTGCFPHANLHRVGCFAESNEHLTPVGSEGELAMPMLLESEKHGHGLRQRLCALSNLHLVGQRPALLRRAPRVDDLDGGYGRRMPDCLPEESPHENLLCGRFAVWNDQISS